jgi:TatD DNase family protein
VFRGWHPWFLEGFSAAGLRAALAADPQACVGEIGLDRLRSREIPSAMRDVFESQLAVAAEFARPVALHGAKCWGEVVKACRPFVGRIPAFLFHGFSRSGGLVPEIASMNGFVSVGPAVLNDHAVNYRELVRSLPEGLLLVESDATAENASETPPVEAVAAKVAEIRGLSPDGMAAVLEANADRFAAAGRGR